MFPFSASETPQCWASNPALEFLEHRPMVDVVLQRKTDDGLAGMASDGYMIQKFP